MKLLSDYRNFYWFYETLLKNIEANITEIKKIDSFCIEATDRKFYNIVHQAKIELSEVQYNKDIDTQKLFSDIRNDLHSINTRFEEVLKKNSLAYHCLKDIKFSFVNFQKWFTGLIEPKPEPQILPTLEAIFQDQNDLQELVKLLNEKGFVIEEAGRLIWTGIKHEARGTGLQMVALSEVCRPLYTKGKYTAKQLHQAWTSYFNYSMEVPKWQPGEVEKMTKDYFELFNFVKHSFGIK